MERFPRLLFIALLIASTAPGCVHSAKTTASRAPDVQTFDRDLNRWASHLRVPGMAVGVALEDSLIYFRGVGYADLEKRTPVTPNTIFWIASVTKTFTAVVLKQLEEEGRLSLADELARFPNKYFAAGRIEPGVTLGHVISHTSESRPPGTRFVYNGSRYNLVFNAFDAVLPVDGDTDFVRPFTRAIEDRILAPLRLDHTVTRVASERFDALRPDVVTPHAYDEAKQGYVAHRGPFDFRTSYPSTGLLSSVNDLVRYSHALSSGEIISQEGYGELTAPYYNGPDGPSPYGMGWFSTTFEGVEMHWAYGYGDADAALLLRVPDRDLTLVMLSNTAMPSATSRLGYGNPLNSAIAAAFVKSFVLNGGGPAVSIDYAGDLAGVERRLVGATTMSGSQVYLEEAFANAMMMKFLPAALSVGDAQAWGLLSMINRLFPNFLLEPQRVEVFDLLAQFEEPDALQLGASVATTYESSGAFHPVKSYFSGRIYESLGDTARAVRFYEAVADNTSFFEQGVKHDALRALGRYYARSDTPRASRYLEALIRYKEMLGGRDEEATTLLESMTARRRGKQ